MWNNNINNITNDVERDAIQRFSLHPEYPTVARRMRVNFITCEIVKLLMTHDEDGK